jgi:hypothetical protein
VKANGPVRQLGAATFRAERAQVVLARLQRGGFLVGRSLEIHREPQRANQQASTPAATFCAILLSVSWPRSLSQGQEQLEQAGQGRRGP